MKIFKIRNTMMSILCLALLLILAPAMNANAQTEGTVTASSANIRTSADADSTAMASVLNGAKLTILDEVTGADGQIWYKVEVDPERYGYVRSDLVTKKGEVASNTGTSTITNEGVTAVQPISASVTGDAVKVRADASTSSSQVTTIGKDVVFTVNGTKTNGSETWYQVSFVNNGAEVNGFIRSDLVKLSGELQTPTVTTPDTPAEEPGDGDTEGDSAYAAYEVTAVGETWYLLDNINGKKYPIQKMLTEAEENAEKLTLAQKKVSKQKGTIVILIIILLIIILGIAFLAFKLKDMMDDGAFDFGGGKKPQNNGRSQTGRNPNTRPAGARNTATGANRTGNSNGRPANNNGKPANNNGRPATRSMNGTATKPATQAVKPAGARPVSATVEDVKNSVQSATGFPPTEKQIEEESKKTVEELEKKMKEDSSTKKRQSKNFMEDDEFAFEFLNWEDEE